MQVLSFAFYAAAALLVVVGGLWLRQLVVARHTPAPSSEPYECGEAPSGSAYVPLSGRICGSWFYLWLWKPKSSSPCPGYGCNAAYRQKPSG